MPIRREERDDDADSSATPLEDFASAARGDRARARRARGRSPIPYEPVVAPAPLVPTCSGQPPAPARCHAEPPSCPPGGSSRPARSTGRSSSARKALAWAGGAVMLLGIVFFFVLAVNRGWIGPVARRHARRDRLRAPLRRRPLRQAALRGACTTRRSRRSAPGSAAPT